MFSTNCLDCARDGVVDFVGGCYGTSPSRINAVMKKLLQVLMLAVLQALTLPRILSGILVLTCLLVRILAFLQALALPRIERYPRADVSAGSHVAFSAGADVTTKPERHPRANMSAGAHVDGSQGLASPRS